MNRAQHGSARIIVHDIRAADVTRLLDRALLLEGLLNEWATYGSARIIVGDVGVAKATRRSMVRGMRCWNFVTFLSKGVIVEKH